MNKGTKIALGVGATLLVGWVLYKSVLPPTITIRSFNGNDGSGTYEWNGSEGAIATGGTGGPWGWQLTILPYVAGTGWTMNVGKNGTVKKTVVVNSAGEY